MDLNVILTTMDSLDMTDYNAWNLCSNLQPPNDTYPLSYSNLNLGQKQNRNII